MDSVTTQTTMQRMGRKKRLSGNKVQLLWMSVPVFILGIVFNYVPLWGWIIAFFDYTPGVSVFKSPFVGLQQFYALFATGSEFLLAMRNTIVLSLIGLLLVPLSAILAILLTETRWKGLKKITQIISSFPNFVSWIITYSLFYNFLAVGDGMVNQLLLKLGLVTEPIPFLANSDYSWVLMTIVSQWKGLGYSAIIFIAAIAGIDPELYQAAEVDGAGRFRKIYHITIPGILPTLAVILVLSVGSILNLGFEQYYSFQNPLTLDKLEIIDTYVYRQGLIQMNFSFATMVGIFKTVVSVILLFIANGFYKRVMHRSII